MLRLHKSSILSSHYITSSRRLGRAIVANGVHCPCDVHDEDAIECTQTQQEYSFHGSCIMRYILNSSYQYGYKYWNDEYDTSLKSEENYTKIDTMKIGYCNAASFDIGVGWSSNHSPYPEISKMTIKVFGVTVREDAVMPQGYEAYEIVAHVEVDGQGNITVTPISSSSSSNDEDALQ